MNVIKAILVASLGFVLMFSAPAQADIREVYVCNYHDGKGMADILSARDYYLKQAKKAGLATPDAFVWNLYKGAVPADAIWFTNHTDMMAFAKQAQAEGASPEMAAVNARFETVVDCEASLASRQQVFDGGAFAVSGDTALISANACMLNDGVSPADLKDLWGHIKGVLGGMDEYKNFLLYASTPLTPGANSADMYLYGVNDNLTAWAAGRAAFGESKAAESLMRHFQALMSCDASLWIGQRVVGGE